MVKVVKIVKRVKVVKRGNEGSNFAFFSVNLPVLCERCVEKQIHQAEIFFQHSGHRGTELHRGILLPKKYYFNPFNPFNLFNYFNYFNLFNPFPHFN